MVVWDTSILWRPYYQNKKMKESFIFFSLPILVHVPNSVAQWVRGLHNLNKYVMGPNPVTFDCDSVILHSIENEFDYFTMQ